MRYQSFDVAVEYIIPYTLRSRSATPPVLFGQQFKQNDTFQLWGLHAWVWRSNPSGLFRGLEPDGELQRVALNKRNPNVTPPLTES